MIQIDPLRDQHDDGNDKYETVDLSNTSSNQNVPSETWDRFGAEAYADGAFKAELLANKARVLAKIQAGEQAWEVARRERRALFKMRLMELPELQNICPSLVYRTSLRHGRNIIKGQKDYAHETQVRTRTVWATSMLALSASTFSGTGKVAAAAVHLI